MNTNHKKPPATMPALPMDVIVEILYRLPVKTLLRFRSLSKQFRSIIDGPDFINRHLQYHRSLNRRRLIVEGGGGIPFKFNLFSVDLDSADNGFKLELPFESWVSVRLIGSCDGLLALSISCRTTICLWNISTRTYQILPEFWSDYRYSYHDVFDGFGYDVATDDYKLVRVFKDRNFMIQVIVYSLKANSWRRIENYPPYHNYTSFNKGIGVLVGGALNWVVALLDINEYRVMSFDLKGEKFYEVPMPEIWDEAEATAEVEAEATAEVEAEIHVVALEGCLCLSYFYHSALNIWVMKEYGVKESWTKLFTLSTESRFVFDDCCLGIVAFTYSKSSNKVLVYQVDGEVYWHDLDKERDVGVEIKEWPTFIRCATIYMDSLVSPKVSR